MAHECQARDSDEQDGANAQAVDCHIQVLEIELRASCNNGAVWRWRGNTCCDAPLVAPHVSQHGHSGDCPVASNSERACSKHESVAAERGSQELSGRIKQGTFAQYAHAA